MKKPERWRVEPGDAIGIGIRIPGDKLDLVLNLFKPVVKKSHLIPPDNYPTIYVTHGKGVHNGRETTHKFINVICEPPPWISVSPALGSLAWIGSPRSSPNRLFWRHGYKKGHARISLSVSDDHRSAHARINANGYTLQVEATFPVEGEYWDTLHQNYCGMDPKTRVVVQGNERGVRYDGTGIVTIKKKNGKAESFEAYIGLDTQLGWDYTL
jgi:hypothetical protein